MNKLILTTLFLLFSAQANAGCWEITNLKGYSALKGNTYTHQADRIPGKHILLIHEDYAYFGGTGANKSDLKHIPISPTTAMGLYKENNVTTTETISIDGNRVLYTKISNRATLHSNISGTHSFVGDATPCKL